jgi:hypothetical protein
VRQGTKPAAVRQRLIESRQGLLEAFGERERVAGVVEERGPVDRLRQQLRRSVQRAERQRATTSAGSFAFAAATASVPNTLGGTSGSSPASRRRRAIRGAASSAVSASNWAAPSAAPSSVSAAFRSVAPRRARVRSNTSSASRLRPPICSMRPSARVIET